MGVRIVLLTFACATAALCAACGSDLPPGVMGAYRFGDGRIVSIRRSLDGTLRYRIYDSGQSQRLYHDGGLRFVSGPGFSSREPVDLKVDFVMDGAERARALVFHRRGLPRLEAKRVNREEWVTFDNGTVELSGRVDFPDEPEPYPAIVLVHGSGRSAATEYLYTGDFFAAHGIAALTFDKRGAGSSGGEYTFDFYELAADVVAAVEYLKGRTDIDAERIGLAGYSQGGWVAPLAASLSPDIRYVIVGYGLVASPAEEARVETRNAVRESGVADEASLEQVDELTMAAVAVVASDFEEGWDEFEAVEEQYDDAPWRDHLSGTVVGRFLDYPRFLVEFLGRRRAPEGLDWYYDSTPVLEALSVPLVWFVGEADRSAPPELAIPMLRRLIAHGKPYDLVVYPDADHSMLVFEESGGTRTYTGYVPGYWGAEVEAALKLSVSNAPR